MKTPPRNARPARRLAVVALTSFWLVAGLAGIEGLVSGSPSAGLALADDDDGGGDDGGGGGGGGPAGSGAGGSESGGDRASQRSGGAVRGPALLDWLFPQNRPPERRARPATELVAIGLRPESVARLRREGIVILGERTLTLVPGVAVRIRIPPGRSVGRRLQQLRLLAPEAIFDTNQRFRQSYRVQTGRSRRGGAFDEPLVALGWPDPSLCRLGGTIGIIDTGVDRRHPALREKRLTVETARSPGRQPSSTRHGTSMATLLLGDGVRMGAAPDAAVIVVEAFHRTGGVDEADVFDLVAGLDILAQRGVDVINLSLAGPANEVLDKAGAAARKRGIALVAAAGNDGPNSLAFPAAYGWAVAVTATDRDNAIYRRAGRGAHIRFAAPGVSLPLTDAQGREALHSGTSFATIFVAAAIASERRRTVAAADEEPVTRLAARALDLGAPGPDATFGAGLLQLGQACG